MSVAPLKDEAAYKAKCRKVFNCSFKMLFCSKMLTVSLSINLHKKYIFFALHAYWHFVLMIAGNHSVRLEEKCVSSGVVSRNEVYKNLESSNKYLVIKNQTPISPATAPMPQENNHKGNRIFYVRNGNHIFALCINTRAGSPRRVLISEKAISFVNESPSRLTSHRQ